MLFRSRRFVFGRGGGTDEQSKYPLFRGDCGVVLIADTTGSIDERPSDRFVIYISFSQNGKHHFVLALRPGRTTPFPRDFPSLTQSGDKSEATNGRIH